MKSAQTEIVRPFPMHYSAAERVWVTTKMYTLLQQPHVRQHLYERGLLSVVNTYGTTESAAERAFKNALTQHEARKLGSYVLYAADGSLQGFATIDSDPLLRKQKIQLPRMLLGALGADHKAVTGPRITAFVIPGEGKKGERALTAAYRQLGEPDGIARDFYPKNHTLPTSEVTKPSSSQVEAYAIEPRNTPDWIQRSIINGGFLRQDSGFYADENSRVTLPVRSRLYVAKSLDIPALLPQTI